MDIQNNNIFIKEKDYQEYIYSSNRQNRILRFWISIFRNMPGKLQSEAKSKPTNLIKQHTEESEVKGAILYRFKTEGASNNLQKYLDSYGVFVEMETEETIEWKQQIRDLKLKFI